MGTSFYCFGPEKLNDSSTRYRFWGITLLEDGYCTKKRSIMKDAWFDQIKVLFHIVVFWRKWLNIQSFLWESFLIQNSTDKETLIDFLINPFHATGLFRYPLKTSENQRLSDVFRGYQKRPVAWNGLRYFCTIK